MIWHEYHLPPWEVSERFTPELLHLMLNARYERIRRVNEAMERAREEGPPSKRVKPDELFALMGINTKRNVQ